MNKVTELLQPVENDLDDLILELKNLINLLLFQKLLVMKVFLMKM